jgi:MFS family permease
VLGQRVFGWARRTPYLADLPRDVAVLSFVAFAVALGYGIAAPALPVYARTFGVSAFVASTVISGFALMRLLSAGPAGLMVDRFGERRVMSIGIWVVAGSSLLTALAQSFPQLLVLRGVGGIGSAMFTVSAMALLLRTAGPEQRGRASGAFQAGFLFGGVTGPAIGGAVTGISIRAPFVVYGATLVVAGLLAAKYLSREPSPAVVVVPPAGAEAVVEGGEPTAAGADVQAAGADVQAAGAGAGAGAAAGADAGGAAPPKAPPASLSMALRSAAYRAALMVNLSSGFIVFGLRISLVPLFVTEGLKEGVGLVGIGFLCAAATQAVMLIPAGRWTDTSGRRGSMLVGAATLTGSMLLIALETGAVGFLLAMAASGLASAFLAPASSAVVGDLTRGLSGGRVVSAYQMVGDLGGILGPLIAGALADAAGFQWAFAAGVVIGLVTLAFVVVMPETLRREPESATAGAP